MNERKELDKAIDALALPAAESLLDAEDLSGVPEHFREVARVHGRALFMLLYASGVSEHAVVTVIAAAGRNHALRTAMTVIADMHNVVAKELIKAQGWTDAEIAQCDHAIRKTVDEKIIVPRGPGIVLDS